ncbi:hypothetical protein B0J14DRAFT_576685 [Halenospora varia]|nr:hypothetical protein B0J14DRAFT_576685 [Halenospora varia]
MSHSYRIAGLSPIPLFLVVKYANVGIHYGFVHSRDYVPFFSSISSEFVLVSCGLSLASPYILFNLFIKFIVDFSRGMVWSLRD